jgi:hypothetical protein
MSIFFIGMLTEIQMQLRAHMLLSLEAFEIPCVKLTI